MHYDYTMLRDFVARLFSDTEMGEHGARVTATATLRQGLLFTKQATLAGMGRGATRLDAQQRFVSQRQRAHRLMKNAAWDARAVGTALHRQLTAGLTAVTVSVDETPVGAFMILEACLGVDGRGIPFSALAVPAAELAGPQTGTELQRWYARTAMRSAGQRIYV